LRTEDSVTGSLAVIDPRFMEWYRTTESGNLEELTFPLTYEDRGKVNVDDSCAGKACPLYDSCFYYVAKRARADADVVVTNHSLLALHHLYPGAGILPDTDVLVVDEAHQLPDYVRNALGIEFTVTGVRLAIRKLENAGDADEEKLDACDEWVALFDQEVTRFMADKEGGEVGVYGTTTFPSGIELASRLDHFANSVWGDGDLPDSAEEIRLARAANGVRSMAGHLRVFSSPTEDGHVRIVKRQAGGNGLLFCSVPFDVSEFIAGLCGIFPRLAPVAPVDHTRCARCHRTLTAEKVAVLEGRPYGPDCIQVVDVLGDAEVVPLAWWLANTLPKPTKPLGSSGSSPVIFTSATLAAPDMGAIKREYGLTSALEMQALSPFPYKRNMILFMPDADAPAPNAADRGPHLDYMVDTMHALVTAAQGGAFLLFTSNAALRYAVDNLGKKFQRMGLPVYVQGELPKMEIAKRVREDGNAVLFATKSFWEGVDIQGDALRLVVIDKLPFEAPNPLNQAQEAALRRYAEQEMGLRGNKLEWYPFEAMRVPRMVIDLKQGAGRLIRTATDAGVVAVLDPRVRKTQYGRNRVLPALPPGQVTSKLETACAFLRKRQVVVDGGGR
jgi:Rad3-related DNA helicase